MNPGTKIDQVGLMEVINAQWILLFNCNFVEKSSPLRWHLPSRYTGSGYIRNPKKLYES